jgi:hypothetical protein
MTGVKWSGLTAQAAFHRRLLDRRRQGQRGGDAAGGAPGRPLEIKVRGYSLTLRKAEAANIMVEVVL